MSAAATVLVLVLLAGAGARAAHARRRPRRSWLPTRADARGAVGWRPRPPSWVEARIGRADPGLDPELVWTAWLGGMAALLSGGVAVGGLGLALLAGGAWMLAPAVCEGMVRRRTERRAAADVPAVLEATARGLRSGSSLATALADAAASTPGVVGAGLDRVVSAAARGQPLVEGLEQWGADCEVPGVRVAVSALVLAAEVGGPQAAALDGVATTLRQRAAARAEAVALGSQARMSAWVIAVAPVVFAVLASAADRRNAEFLLRTRVGLALLVAGLGLDAAGALWMARLTRMADP